MYPKLYGRLDRVTFDRHVTALLRCLVARKFEIQLSDPAFGSNNLHAGG